MASDANRLLSPSLQTLYQQAVTTFGNEDAALAWCERAHPLLEGKSPFDCCQSSGAFHERAFALICAVRYGGAA
jgi:uncharacterized protein (DUF2384 family)